MNDLTTGEAALGASMSSYETASFHAQQAAEKSLKALLIRHQVVFDKTHNLEALFRLAEPAAPGLTEGLGEARNLTPYAVAGRYPGPPPIEREEAARHLALAKKVVAAIESLMKPYLEAGSPG